MMERLVILGNGGAALSAVRGARVSGYRGEICLVSDVDAPAFNPMLSPYYLKGLIAWGKCFPFGDSFYRDHDVTCVLGSPVESLDAVNRQIGLANGKRLSYDRCVVATGARPTIPPVPGLQGSPRTHVMRTAASIKALEAAAGVARKAVVLGASFVGLKAAEILVKRHLDVVVMDVADQVLPQGGHPYIAAMIRTLFERHGVKMRLGCTIEGIEGSKQGLCCYLPGNITEETDLVVVCTGVRPNTDFLNPEQVTMEHAIVTDERMGTSAANLYAAGDVCRGVNLLSGTQQWLGTWYNACRQGKVAGCNMAGKEVAYYGAIPENVSPFFQWTYAQVGDVGSAAGGSGRSVAFGEDGKEEYGLLVLKDGVLVGANLVNCTWLSGLLRQAVLMGSCYLGDRSEIHISGRSAGEVEAFFRSAQHYSPRYAFFT
jgi:NADPH-dependent 2,4-dienoyl-CoA reductase/sulfur reductase-like enzyme